MYMANIGGNSLFKQMFIVLIHHFHQILPLILSTFSTDNRPISSGKCVKQFERNESILKLVQLPIYIKTILFISSESIFLHLLVSIEFDYDLRQEIVDHVIIRYSLELM